MNLAGRHAVITGGSTGIGRATARLLVERGAAVTLIARGEANLRDAADKIGARWEMADVSDRSALIAAIDRAETAAPIDLLFANAGTGGSFAPVEAYPDDEFDAVIATNLTSVFHAIKRVIPGMIERRYGSILVTGSLASERGMAMNAAYVASKHGVLGLSRAVAIEAAPHNVRCNCIIPGFIVTPMLGALGPDALARLGAATPQGRIGTADELAEVATFLLSDAASHVTGQAWAVDGGMLGTLKIGE